MCAQLHARGRLFEAHKVSYSIGISGTYLLHVRLRNEAASLPGSPFLLQVVPGEAYARSSTLPTEPLEGECGGTDCTLLLETGDKLGNRCIVGGAHITGKPLKPVDPISLKVEDHSDGTYLLRWSCDIPGTYQAHVLLDDEPLINSPVSVMFRASVPVLEHCVLSGSTLPAEEGVAGQAVAKTPMVLRLDFRDRFGNPTMVGNYAGVEEAFKVGVSMIHEKDKQKGTGSKPSIPNMSHKYEGRWIRDSIGRAEAYELSYSAATTGKQELHVWFEASCVAGSLRGPSGVVAPIGEKIACRGTPFWMQVARHPDDLVDTDGQGATAQQDYMVERSVYEECVLRWGACTIDAFSSEATALLPRFWTAKAVAGGPAEGVDAFAQAWTHIGASGGAERLWVHPPVELLMATAEVLHREDRTCEALVCCPSWCKKQVWEFEKLCDDKLRFPHNRLKPVAEDAPQRIEEWALIIFRIPARL